jgi:hypothetical protein
MNEHYDTVKQLVSELGYKILDESEESRSYYFDIHIKTDKVFDIRLVSTEWNDGELGVGSRYIIDETKVTVFSILSDDQITQLKGNVYHTSPLTKLSPFLPFIQVRSKMTQIAIFDNIPFDELTKERLYDSIKNVLEFYEIIKLEAKKFGVNLEFKSDDD